MLVASGCLSSLSKFWTLLQQQEPDSKVRYSKREVLWVYRNIISGGSFGQKEQAIQEGAIEKYVQAIQSLLPKLKSDKFEQVVGDCLTLEQVELCRETQERCTFEQVVVERSNLVGRGPGPTSIWWSA